MLDVFLRDNCVVVGNICFVVADGCVLVGDKSLCFMVETFLLRQVTSVL